VNNGFLSGGSVTVSPDPVCINNSLIFTVSGVTDSGGTKRANCNLVTIPGVPPSYAWTITKPDGMTVTGSGATATVVADKPGTYSCTFTVTANRECPPAARTVGPKTGKAVKFRPQSVTFGGANMYAISRDDGLGVYPSPHWQDKSNPRDDDNDDVGDHNIPVAYVRNAYMSLTGQFTVEPADGLGTATSATVAGVGTAGAATYRFSGTGTVSGGLITLSNAQADVALPNTVQYYNPMSIAWTITPTTGPPLNCSVANTTHRIYVLLAIPNSGSRYETLIHLTSTDAAGKNNENDTVAAIWNEFTDRVASRKPKDGFNNPDGAQLTYYANWNCVNTTTATVLTNGDGQCGAWASLFIDAMGAQGINHANEYVAFYQSDGAGPSDFDYGFAVKNWSFACGSGISGVPSYPYLNIPPVSGFPESGNAYTWRFAEVSDATGVAGQGNANPKSLFGNHQVVKFGTSPLYYDPSYGLTYTSLADIDNNAVDGYYQKRAVSVNELQVGVDLNNDTHITDTIVTVNAWVFKRNPTGNQLIDLLGEYP